MDDVMYSTPEAVRIVGSTMANVNYWDKQGVATATVPARGIGSHRLYSYEDLFVLFAMAKLADETNIATRKTIAAALRASGAIADSKQDSFTVRLSSCVEVWINLRMIRDAIPARTIAKSEGS